MFSSKISTSTDTTTQELSLRWEALDIGNRYFWIESVPDAALMDNHRNQLVIGEAKHTQSSTKASTKGEGLLVEILSQK